MDSVGEEVKAGVLNFLCWPQATGRKKNQDFFQGMSVLMMCHMSLLYN